VERKIIQVPTGYPASTFFVDESRARAAGGRFFCIAAVKLRAPGGFARSLREIRDRRGFRGEFKFRTATTGTLSAYYDAIDLLESSTATIHGCVVDTDIYDPFQRSRSFWQVHGDITAQLLVGSINRRELVTVMVDHVSCPTDHSYEDVLRRRVNTRLSAMAVVSAHCLDSKCTDLLQLADLVAGAIAYERGIRAENYKPKTSEKTKIVGRLKAALGGVDLTDGRSSKVNIATYRSPSKSAGQRLRVVGGATA
jgi:hypothetical protein